VKEHPNLTGDQLAAVDVQHNRWLCSIKGQKRAGAKAVTLGIIWRRTSPPLVIGRVGRTSFRNRLDTGAMSSMDYFRLKWPFRGTVLLKPNFHNYHSRAQRISVEVLCRRLKIGIVSLILRYHPWSS
jgi:hypothetical protein